MASGNVIGFALRAAESATMLQFGELAKHFGGEVTFGSLRHGRHREKAACIMPRLNHCSSASGRRHECAHLVAVAAQAGFVGDPFEFGEIVGERHLVCGPENWGRRNERGSTRSCGAYQGPWNPGGLMTARHAGAVPAPLFSAKIFLVVAHHRDQDFVRQVQNGIRTCPG